MPMWRCPHCGTPQAETARCWVCRRSSTTCSTCRHFRRSVAARVGYCGLDRRRLPLTGTELRGCWEAGPPRIAGIAPAPAPDVGSAAEPATSSLRLRDFVPVELVRDGRVVVSPAPGAAARPEPGAAARPEPGAAARPEPPAPGPVVATLDEAGADRRPEPGAGAQWADRITLFGEAELQP